MPVSTGSIIETLVLIYTTPLGESVRTLVFGIGIILIAAGCVGIAIYLWTKTDDSKYCTEHVVGTVVGGGHVNYGNNQVPRCSYVVNGYTYEVDGPLFESGTTAPGLKCNCTSRENLPKKFKGPQIADPPLDMRSNDDWYKSSALYPLYPVGSPVDIYYDIDNPSHAYVQRPVRKWKVAIMFFAIWALCLGPMGFYFISSAFQAM